MLVVGEPIEERPLDELRLERLPQQLGAAGCGGDHFVGRRSDRRHLETDLLQIDVQLVGQDLVDRIELEQPARRREHPLLLPPCGGPISAKRIVIASTGLPGKRRADDVVQPAVALLVRGEHRDRGGPSRRRRL